MRRSLTAPLALGLALLLATAATAQEPIRFARLPDISPDGKLVAFSYLGDVWVVETIGGVARPVTMHEAHDAYPVFSPDGQSLAFASNRYGSYDVFVVPVTGGHPRRLTCDSAIDLPCGWSPDGKNVLFASSRATDFPPNYQLYTVPVEGGRVRRITADQGKEGVFSPRGDQIAYVRGQGLWYRKGYRGSCNDDIWLCNADGTHNRPVTTFNGQDTSPMWAPDGQALYYVSELFGTPANVVRQDLSGKQPPKQLTFHKDDGVRRARISGNGEWIVYECGADLYVVSTHDGKPPRKLAIEVHADDKVNPDTLTTFTDGAAEFAPTRDERHVAFAVHGDLFLMPLPSGKVTRLTDSAAYDHGMAWAPDSSKLIFLSDRDGQEDLYLLESAEADHHKVVDAHQFKVTRLTNTPEAEAGVSFAPDGKRVAFLRAGRLWTMKPDGTDAKAVVKDVHVIDYEWSPDSKWLCYARRDGSFASELYIIPSGGATADQPARNVTHYATYNAGITWSHDGKTLAFLSERQQTLGVYVLPLQKPAAPNAPSTDGIDWDEIELRAHAVAPLPASEAAISADGSKVAFASGSRGGEDLWVASTSGGHISRVTSDHYHPTQIQWSRRFPNTVYFKSGKGQLYMAHVGGSDLAGLFSGKAGLSSGSATAIPFKVKMVVRRDQEFAEMLEQSWRALADNFYDPKFHGVDWNAVRAKYRPLVKHCAMKEDLYALISLMMGELNASHLGISGPSPSAQETTADLGLLFDEGYRGPGLKVKEVVKRGPADRRGINLKPGMLITAIDGTPVAENTNVSALLNGKGGETVSLQVLASPTADPKDAKARHTVEVQAVDRDHMRPLMYARWVDHNARRVAELSGGRLGYIHIPSMDQHGLDTFVRALYSDNFDKDAIVLDVRYNGGGFTHDQVLNYLGAREHSVFRQRDGGEGLVLRSYDRKWTKPLVLLINDRSYSDAEIFPSAFRTLGLGKLVGVPTAGMVIGTSSVELIDGSSFRIPRIGVYTAKGQDMETKGVAPDVLVEQTPDEVAKGIDPQLDKAVAVLTQDVVAWKKSHAAPGAAAATHPAAAVLTPMPPAG
ncbi:MAG TPA: S41 family peptidase, partial [Gemmataceae bacterium]|nr:S41 family peptidase [Gemmataceae bacterium]